MQSRTMSLDDMKKNAAYRAVDDFVRSGFIVGLGTGSTAAHVATKIAESLRVGTLKDIVCVPTSEQTRKKAQSLGIPLITLDELQGQCDVAIDGADEIVGKELHLLKGRGAALVREKFVEIVAKLFVVVADHSKMMKCNGIGSTGAVPVEIVPYGAAHTINRLKKAVPNCVGTQLRLADPERPDPLVTDNGNFIVDLFFEEPYIVDPAAASTALSLVTGVVDHGLFIGMAAKAVIAYPDGSVQIFDAQH